MAGLVSGLTRSVGDALASFGRRSVVGLSIEGNDLRLICVSGREMVRLVSRPLGSDVIPGGVVVDAGAFAVAVRTILNDYDIPRSTIVAGFPDLDARSRLLTLPKDASTKLADVVKREARHDEVIGKGDYRIYHQVVSEGQTQIQVFVLAVKQAALTQYLEGLRQAGVIPQMVEMRPLAMIRAINQPHTIIAHIERTALDVIIVANNLPVIMRSVPLSEAGIVEVVVQELGRTIDAYNSDHPLPLSARLPVALTGELADTPDLQQAVQDRLGHPIATLTCPFAAPAGFAVPTFIVNIGLVLKAR